MPDQFRRFSLGYWRNHPELLPTYGDPVHTPNLDRLAEQGVVYTNATSNCPLCSPFRGMFMSGRFPHRNGVTENCNSSRPHSFLRPSVTCLGDVLHDAGYTLGYIGKYHLDHPIPNDPDRPGRYVNGEAPPPSHPVWDAYTPPSLRHGFDSWYSYGTFDVHKRPHYWDSEGRRHTIEEWSPVHEADVAIRYLEHAATDRERPFGLIVAMNPPHPPYRSLDDTDAEAFHAYYSGDVVPEVRRLLVRRNVQEALHQAAASVRYYFAGVTGVDREIGRVLDALNRLGLAEETVVLFTSDHGEMMGSHGLMHKTVFYQESVGIPLIIRWAGQISPGCSDSLFSAADFLPTLLGLLGQRHRIPDGIDGFDRSGELLRPGSSRLDGAPPEAALYLTHDRRRGIVTRRYTLALEEGESPRHEPHGYLFDRRTDPYELENIYHVCDAELREQLTRLLAAELARTRDPWHLQRRHAATVPYE
jgi:arylsulfatase A-like enzyme